MPIKKKMASVHVEGSNMEYDNAPESPVQKPQTYKNGVILSWEAVSYVIQKKSGDKKILSGVTGYAMPGELLAIMGPSGSGKTSLLNVLASRIGGISGSVMVNGSTVTPHDMRHLAAFVPQDDSLLGFLTVEETVKFSADLHLDERKSDRKTIVDDVIQNLGMNHIRKSKVGSVVVRGVSGGERRRVSIGVELVARKPILFLDEPTSGLDSAASFQVVTMLKNFAVSRGITVLCTIHQPSSETFLIFDKLFLLAYGRTVYFGPTTDVDKHFESLGYPVAANTNIADHFIRLINADFREDKEIAQIEIRELTEKSISKCPTVVMPISNYQPKNGYGTGFFWQTLVLTRRGFINAQRNLVMYWVRLAMYIALAILMGTIWVKVGTSFTALQNRLGCHFFSIAFPCFMSVAGIPAFLEEKNVFDREYASGAYRSLAYVIALSLTSLPFIFLIALCFSSIVYPLIGLNEGADHFFIFLAVMFCSLYCAESLVLFISGAIPIFVISLALTAFMNGFFMLMEGFFIRWKDVPKFWIWGHFISYQKYGFESLVYNDMQGMTFSCVNSPMGCSCVYRDSLNSECKFRGETVLSDLGYENVKVGAWCAVLIAMCIGYRLLFWAMLQIFRKKY